MTEDREARSAMDAIDGLESQLVFDPIEPVPSRFILAARVVAIAAVLLTTVVLITLGLRRDAAELGPWMLWGLLLLELALIYGLFAVLFSEVVPSRKLRTAVWLLIPPVILAVQLIVAYVTYLRSPLQPTLERATTVGLSCMGWMVLIGLVPMALGFWLLSRGLPLRPRLSGLMVGLVAGLVADAVYRLHCPYSALDHIFSWHSASVLLLGILGFIAGTFWDRLTIRRWRARRAPKTDPNS